MTPAASWHPSDYFAARDRARAAWQATQPQLTIDALEEVQVARAGGGESAAAACISSSAFDLAHSPPGSGADALAPNNNGPDRIAREALRGRGQGGKRK